MTTIKIFCFSFIIIMINILLIFFNQFEILKTANNQNIKNEKTIIILEGLKEKVLDVASVKDYQRISKNNKTYNYKKADKNIKEESFNNNIINENNSILGLKNKIHLFINNKINMTLVYKP